jgi:YD repeat-containing protein
MKLLLSFSLLFALQVNGQYSTEQIKKHKINVLSTRSGDYSTEIRYDQYGNDTAHYINAALYQRTKHTYKNGKLQTSIIYNAEGTEYSTKVYEYKSDGTSIATNTDNDFGMKDYTYFDNKGRIIKEVIPDGSQRVHSYDKAGRRIRIKTKPMEGAVVVDVTYTYDSKNRLVKEISNGEYKWTNVYTYDKNGLIKNKTISWVDDEEKKTSVTEYTYKFRK